MYNIRNIQQAVYNISNIQQVVYNNSNIQQKVYSISDNRVHQIKSEAARYWLIGCQYIRFIWLDR